MGESRSPAADACDGPETPKPRTLLWALVVVAVVSGGLLAPVIGAGFFGDDYDLWHMGQVFLADPSIAFVGPANFYRPANMWLFAVNDLLFATDPVGYHVMVLAMHLLAGLLLGFVTWRLVGNELLSGAVALLWLVSPFSFEPVLFVNVAFNDLTVLVVWLAVAAVWPGPGGRWTGWRVTAASGLVLGSVFCKESWVIIVPLVAAYGRWISRWSLSRSLATAALVAAPVMMYVGVYAVTFADRESYLSQGIEAGWKIPHLWSAFLRLTPLSHAPGLGAPELVMAGVMVLVAVWGVLRGSGAVLVGLAIYLASLLPVLLVAWLPSRYTAAPLAGFLLVVAGVAEPLLRSRVLAIRALVVSALAILLATTMIGLRNELVDMERLTQPHDRLRRELEVLASELPVSDVVVGVRLAEPSPLHRLASEGDAGLQKPYFVREEGPYGLASWPAVLTFAQALAGRQEVYERAPAGFDDSDFLVVAHRDGGFNVAPSSAGSLAVEVAQMRRRGLHPVVLRSFRRNGSNADPELSLPEF